MSLSPHKLKNTKKLSGIKILWLFFTLFILYGTLIPFKLCLSRESIISNISNINLLPFIDPDGTRASIPDIVQNILFFLPFGFIGFFSMTLKKAFNIIIITFLGFLLSLSVEILQLFTIDRISSMTDILTNTGGTLLGAISAYIFLLGFSKIINLHRFQQYSHNKYFFLVLIVYTIVAVGALQPFDFTLDVGHVGPKIKSLLYNPLNFSYVIRDEVVVLFRLFLFGYVCALWFLERNLQFPLIKAIVLSASIGVLFEGCQIIIGSRMPNAQDVVVVILGSIFGGIFARIAPTNMSPKMWIILVILTTWITAGTQVFSPFRLTTEYKGFNWIPFLSYYERTTFIALSNFIESVLMYFPMGFALQYIYSHKKRSIVFIGIVSSAIAFPLEFTQGWIDGRYPDITDVIGAIAGAIVGAWICLKWMATFYQSLGVK